MLNIVLYGIVSYFYLEFLMNFSIFEFSLYLLKLLRLNKVLGLVGFICIKVVIRVLVVCNLMFGWYLLNIGIVIILWMFL